MSNLTFLHRSYYRIRPFLPRGLQLYLRRKVIAAQRSACGDRWPIDTRAAAQPEGWQGWPDGKRFAFVLTHDVEKQRGHDRALALMAMEKEMGFRSSFNFVPERYNVDPNVRTRLAEEGFEIGVHDLKHDGKLYLDEKRFSKSAKRINGYLREWKARGFRSGSMHCNLEWIKKLDILYDSSTFDTDPFEPQPEGRQTIFPFLVNGASGGPCYVELPYTLPQDFTLYVLMQERTARIWKEKLDWIAAHGGMALLITHPDYTHLGNGSKSVDEYGAEMYKDFLAYVKDRYAGAYWNALPREVAEFWMKNVAGDAGASNGER